MAKMSRQVRRQMLRNGGELRTPGFTAVQSERLARFVQRQTLAIALEIKGKSLETLKALGLPTNVGEVQEEAQRRVVKTLPQERMVPNYRVKPCRNNSAKWRRSGVDTGPVPIAVS